MHPASPNLHFMYCLSKYKRMLKTIDISEMYKKFDITHFTFMVITNEDFSCFSKYQKLFKLSDEDIDKLKEEFEKVKIYI